MFKLISKNVLNSFLNPKFYFSIILGSVLYLFNAFMLLEYSMDIGEPLNILEVWVYGSSSAGTACLAFLGILFFLSNIPFEKDETFQLLRLSKLKWSLYKISYTTCMIIIYYTIIILLCSIIVSKNSFFANIWSYPMYILTFGDSSVRLSRGLSLDAANILCVFTPMKAAIISFILTIMYSLIMVLLNMLFNILHVNGIAITVTIHAFGYFLAYYNPKYSFLSIMNHSILSNHFYNNEYSNPLYPSLTSSFIIYSMMIIVQVLIIIVIFKKCDCVRIVDNEYEI